MMSLLSLSEGTAPQAQEFDALVDSLYNDSDPHALHHVPMEEEEVMHCDIMHHASCIMPVQDMFASTPEHSANFSLDSSPSFVVTPQEAVRWAHCTALHCTALHPQEPA
jgi:hypothetical protein